MQRNEYAIVVAGGKGSRMQSDIAKQFLILKKLPVLMHTLNAFYNYSNSIKVILVLPEKDIEQWNKLCAKYSFRHQLSIARGGSTRFQSVKNGLRHIKDETGLVAIHDGVRPLVSKDTIAASFNIASMHQSAVASVRLKDSIRITTKDATKALDRSAYRLIQTPQTFALEIVKKAYEIEETADLTDDASVVEKSGHQISLFEGSYENIKITTPEDMVIATALMDSKSG